MPTPRLSDAAIEAALQSAELAGWRLVNGKLHRDYEFADFCAAMGYMVEVALHVERMDHHPEWFNVYNKVVVDLTTHDAGGVSARDIELASVMERLAAQRAK